MKRHKLPYNYQQHPPIAGIDAIECIMIYPRSSGRIGGGDYIKNDERNIELCISSTNRESVKYDTVLLGSKESYTIVYEVHNYNDSPTFVWTIDNSIKK